MTEDYSKTWLVSLDWTCIIWAGHLGHLVMANGLKVCLSH